MDYKSYFKKTIIYTLAALVVIGALVVIIDPFVHYHKPIGKLVECETDERGALIGVAKNMDYDTALIGSSMSENFKASWFEDGILGNECVKLCMQGAHFDDFSRLLNVVTKKPDVKRIIYSLDNYVLLNVPDEYPTTIPDYLENDTIKDDAYYLWNKSVTFYYLPIFLANNVMSGYNADSAYSWADRYTFEKYVARATYDPVRLVRRAEEEPFDKYFSLGEQFLNGIIPYIEARPDIEFDFYAPPYSILYWDDCVLRGRLTSEICLLNEVYEKLLEYDNVRIFYFQDNYDIITNLNNYKDYSHYSQDINYYIYECIRDGKEEITRETEFDTLLKHAETMESFNFESCFH